MDGRVYVALPDAGHTPDMSAVLHETADGTRRFVRHDEDPGRLAGDGRLYAVDVWADDG